MPDWKKIIVGDAFKIHSRNVRYHTDRFLLMPTLVFGWSLAGAITRSPAPEEKWRVVAIFGLLFLLCVLLLKERLASVIALLAYTAVLATGGLFDRREWVYFLTVILFCAAVSFLLFWPNRERLLQPSATYPYRGSYLFGPIDTVGLSCQFVGFALAILIRFGVTR